MYSYFAKSVKRPSNFMLMGGLLASLVQPVFYIIRHTPYGQ
jgi:hypothetical protein